MRKLKLTYKIPKKKRIVKTSLIDKENKNKKNLIYSYFYIYM